MKKLLLITFALMITFNLFAQTNNEPIYVIFTSTTEKIPKGVAFATGYDSKVDRTPVRIYFFVDLKEEYFRRFWHSNKKKDPENPIITKPLSFLNTVKYLIDWDVIGPSLTKAQAEQKFEEIESHKTIYFIDRREIENNTIKLIPVIVLKSTF